MEQCSVGRLGVVAHGYRRMVGRIDCGVNSALSNRYTPMASNISSAVA